MVPVATVKSPGWRWPGADVGARAGGERSVLEGRDYAIRHENLVFIEGCRSAR